MSAAAPAIAGALLAVIRREFGSSRHAAKRLAAIANSSVRTSESWLQEIRCPTVPNLISICAESEAVRDELFRQIELSKQQRTKNAGATRNAGQGGDGA